MSDTSKIRVLIVDDSTVVRHILSDIFKSEPTIEVVGSAANGKLGLAQFEILKPDLVTLDIEMPEMNGLETLAKIREKNKKIPVIMFSSLTQKGGIETLEALGLGATDYVTKPTNEAGGLSAAKASLREQILQKVLFFGGREKREKLSVLDTSKTPLTSTLARPSLGTSSRVDIVAIGVSTGGPNALAEIFSKFPKNFPVPIVIVQHMPAYFTKVLAQRLSSQSVVQVQEGETGGTLRSGQALIAPGGFHMILQKNGNDIQVKLNEEAPENSCRPAVDPLFTSVSKCFGPHVLGVVLTGMGKDGLRGSESIRQAGGDVFVQDEATSVVWSMPRYVAEAGLASRVLPISGIADEITRRVSVGRSVTPRSLL